MQSNKELKIALTYDDCVILCNAITDRILYEEKKIKSSKGSGKQRVIGLETKDGIESRIKQLKSIRKILTDFRNECL